MATGFCSTKPLLRSAMAVRREEKSELVGTTRGLWEGCREQQERGRDAA